MANNDKDKGLWLSLREEYPDWGYIALALLLMAVIVAMGIALAMAWHFNLLPRKSDM